METSDAPRGYSLVHLCLQHISTALLSRGPRTSGGPPVVSSDSASSVDSNLENIISVSLCLC